MTQRDLNYLTKWVYDVKAAHTIRNNDGDFEGTPTQLNFKLSVASDLIRSHIINVKVYGQDNIQQLPDFLTMPSPSPNLCDSNEQTNQTPEDRLRAWVKLCLRKKIGGLG